MPDRTGQQFGNYHLIRLLGRGGFAEVYLGQHLRLSTQQAAIKILHAQLSDEAGKDFQREAETIASLVHPHIVRILDFDVKDNTPFLVMDYAPNGSLRQRHPRGQQVPLPTVVSYVKQVTDALQYAHDQKLIHRDVKPENMLIGRRSEILLSDFGIATISHDTSSMSAQAAIGTLPYMAPEQIREHPRSASDQYALGVVVYEWLCGAPPFVGDTVQLMYQHIHVPPPSLRERVLTISPEVEQVVFTALAKDSKERFGSVQAFANALEQASRSVQPQLMLTSLETPVPVQPLEPTILDSPKIQLPPTVAVVPADHSVQPKEITTPPGKEVETPAPVTSPGQPFQQASIPVVQPRPEQARRGISRRTVIIGLGAAGVVALGGGITWWFSQHPAIGPAIGTLLYTYGGHSGNVSAVAWSPDGKRIASGSYDKTVQVWDAANGGNIYTYQGHSDVVEAVVWSSDGRRIASGSDDHTVQVWDAGDGGNAYTSRGHTDEVFAVAWSPDGRRIASAGADKTVLVCSAG